MKMKMGCLITLGIAVLACVFLMSGCGYVVSVFNRETGIRNQFKATEQKVGLVHDTMWKTIQQKVDVSDNYKDGLVQVTQAVVQGRTGGALFKTVQESMPGLDVSIYKEVMATVEGKRHELLEIQSAELQLQKEDNDLLTKFPSSLVFMFVHRDPLEVKLITSSKTRDAQSTGRDDDVSLRSKPTTQK